MPDQDKFNLTTIASYVLAALALLMTLYLGLLAALFSGLLVYSLVHLLTAALGNKISDHRARAIAVAILGALIMLLLALLIWGLVTFFQSDAGNLQVLMRKLADLAETSRDQMPPWLKDHIPGSAEAIGEALTAWLRAHAEHAQTIGQQAGRTIAHLLIGMAIGAMAALYDTTTMPDHKPLAAALHVRVVNLNDSFRRIVFAQVQIAAINTVLTAIYLLIVLPLTGTHLPLSKSMVAFTFFAGLLPVVGNLISNSVVVMIGLSHSLAIALASLAYLILVHKLEYFLNAKIIGSHINARAWELLTAMLAMEAMFGLPGVVAAPVLYAYLKKELRDCGLV